MTENEIRDRLYSAAQRVVAAEGLRFGRGADGDLDNWAQSAAAELTASPDSTRLAEAEDAFRRLARAMLEGRRSIDGYTDRQDDVVGEETLTFAMPRLCPLWPFC